MKNLLLAFTIASVFGACTDTKKDAEFKPEIAPVNTAGYNMNDASTDIAKSVAAEDEDQAEEIVIKKKKAKKRVVTVYEEPDYEVQQPSPAPVVNNYPTQSVPQQTGSTIPGAVDTGSGEATGNAGVGETAQVEKKKGWSDAAKGAVIGGAAGAIGGAVINGKNRGKGAIIGAVIGAAGGYVIGRKRDKNKDEVSPYSMVVNK